MCFFGELWLKRARVVWRRKKAGLNGFWKQLILFISSKHCWWSRNFGRRWNEHCGTGVLDSCSWVCERTVNASIWVKQIYSWSVNHARRCLRHMLGIGTISLNCGGFSGSRRRKRRCCPSSNPRSTNIKVPWESDIEKHQSLYWSWKLTNPDWILGDANLSQTLTCQPLGDQSWYWSRLAQVGFEILVQIGADLVACLLLFHVQAVHIGDTFAFFQAMWTLDQLVDPQRMLWFHESRHGPGDWHTPQRTPACMSRMWLGLWRIRSRKLHLGVS